MLGLRHHRIWLVVVAILLAAAASAIGAPEQLRTFGAAGSGDGQLGPHASGVAVAPDGTIFVADRMSGRIETFDAEGKPAGAWGEFYGPSALALDGDRILVGDARGVHAHSLDGAPIESLGGPRWPAGIAVGPDGTVYASQAAEGESDDDDSRPARIAVIGGGAIAVGEVEAPTGLAIGPGGDVFVADAGDETVKRFSRAGEFRDAWPADDPRGIAFAADGSLYVAEAHRHRVGHYLDDGVRIGDLGLGALNVPRGVAVDCRGAVYVVDNSDPRGHVLAEPGTAPPPCPSPPPPPPPPAEVKAEVREAEPEVGRTARATVLGGTVLVGKGASRRRLTGRAMLPIGEQVDASDGTVKLEFEAIGADRDAYGRLMEAHFHSGDFTFHQARDDSLVDITLAGSSPALRSGSRNARTARKAKRRRVWSRARGRFRTRGNHGAATVRGTEWLTEERDGGTFFRVTEGSIAVLEYRTGRTKVLTAPDTFLARAPCVSRRRFRIRLRPPAGTTVTAVRVRMGKKRIPVRRGRRLTALIDLRGRPKGRVVVRIKLRTSDGRVLRGKRDYFTCRRDSGRRDVPKL